MGAGNFDMMRATLINVYWVFILSPLNTTDAWSLFNLLFKKSSMVIFLCADQKRRKMFTITPKCSL